MYGWLMPAGATLLMALLPPRCSGFLLAKTPVYFKCCILMHASPPLLPPPHFSGFLLAKIPVYFIWINKISFLTYAYARLLQSELQGLQVANPADPDGPWVSASTLLPSAINNGEEHLVCSRGAVCAKL